ncbi:MAG: serine/threonine protein kinase/tetratricopeptide (TPR) repeat protein [Myxococcota bacterium]
MSGIRVGAYTVDARVGTGGQGEVWRGVHRESGTRVAVKLLTAPPLRGEAARRALHEEARAVARLSHPAVIAVHDLGTVDPSAAARAGWPAGSPWLAMDLADTSLSARSARRSFGRLRHLLLGVLDGLAHCHARGVLHLDLKPGNVLLANDQPVLADFGLARVVERSAVDGRPSGTPLYMAPEQLDPQARLGPWTDLYALGWLAWELAGGGHPWRDKPIPWVLDAQRGTDPPPLFEAGIPPSFGAWLARLLAKHPADRYRCAADARSALRAVPPDGDDHLLLERRPPSRAAETFTFGLSDRPADTLPPEDLPVDPTPSLPALPAAEPALARNLPLSGLALVRQREAPVVGRAAERRSLWAALSDAVEGRPRVVILRGPAGMGKSRLARWLCEHAHQAGAAEVWRVRCPSTSGPEAALSALVDAGLLSHPDPLFGLPEYTARAIRSLTASPAGAVTVGRSAVDDALATWLARRAAERTQLVWLDDAHAAPALLARLPRLVERVPNLLVVATVQEEALAESAAAHAALDALDAQTLGIGPLSTTDQTALLRSLLDLSATVLDRLIHRTAGNPLFMVQLVGDWVDRGVLEPGPRGFRLTDHAAVALPDDLHAVWTGRTDRLGLAPDDRRALRTAAVLGQFAPVIEHDLWRATTTSAADSTREALLDARLAESRGPRAWAFCHGMLREALVREASEAGELADHHARCAEALHGRGQPEREGRHWLAAGRPDAAVGPLFSAVDAAIVHDAFDAADALLGLVSACLPAADTPDNRGRALACRARLAYWTGDLRAALPLLDQALTLLVDPEHRSRAFRLAADAHLLMGHVDAARTAAESSVLEAASSDGDARWISARVLAEVHVQAGDLDAADHILQPLVVHHRLHGPPELLAAAHHTRGGLERARGRPEASAEAYRRAAEGFRSVGNRARELTARVGLGDALRYGGDLTGATAAIRESLEMARSLRSPDEALCGLNLGLVLQEQERWSEARDVLEQAQAALRRSAWRVLETGAWYALLSCYAIDGDGEAFDGALARLRSIGGAEGTEWVDPDLAGPAARAARLWAAVDPDRAAVCAGLAEHQRQALAHGNG